MKGVYNKLKFLALDSGSKKWGYAFFDGERVVDKGVIEVDSLEESLLKIKILMKPDFIVVGRRRGALEKLAFLKDLEIVTISETDTTLEARKLYFSENPPRGLMRFLPEGLWLPDRAIDDFAAVIIGKRFLNSIEGILMSLRRTALEDVGYNKELLDEPVLIKALSLDCCEKAIDNGSVVEASLLGTKGRAFTPVVPRGVIRLRLGEILTSSLASYRYRANLIAALNALYSYLGKVERVLHCSEEEKKLCVERFISLIDDRWGRPKIGLIGYGDLFLGLRERGFEVKNISEEGTVEWAELFVINCESVVSGEVAMLLGLRKPMISYGPGMAFPSRVLGLERFCPFGK